MGVARWLLVVVLFALSSVFEYLVSPSFWAGFLSRLAFGAGTVALLITLILALRGPLWRMAQSHLDAYVESHLNAGARSYLDTLVGSAVVRSMPPGDVLSILLQRVYPEGTDHQKLSTWILGGAGRDPDCGDTVVSYGTRVRYQVEPVNDEQCLSYMTCRYRYSGVRDDHLLIIFATSREEVAPMIAAQRVYPLYELWILGDDQLDDFVPSQRAAVQVGMRYRHSDGCAHAVEPTPLLGEEVDYRSYDRYLRIPPGFDRNEIRMFVLDLQDLVDDHLIETIDEVTLRSSNVANTDRGYLVWWPPHPCYVEEVSFDLGHLRSVNTDRELMYRLMTTSVDSATMRMPDWTQLRDTISIPVNAWMFPGHTVALWYQPKHESGSLDGHAGNGYR